jgi:23S rRNA pseudouridine1911/1915/1917 synthase
MLTILYEDEYLVAIDKPQGMVVHPGVGNTEHTLSQIVFHTLSSYKKNTAFQSREGIVHRLDKDTSGVILIAKTARCTLI